MPATLPAEQCSSKPQAPGACIYEGRRRVVGEFGCTITYISGRKNTVVDALSRVEINHLHLGIHYEDLAREQAADPETPAYRTAPTALKWEDVRLGGSGATLLCDTSTGHHRLLVPASMRKQTFDIMHGLSHPSGRTTACLMTEKFMWHGIRKDARQWCGGARYLQTIIDCSIHWPQATPMEEASTASCAEALLSSWISHVGVPDSITTDRGSAFLSELWVSLACLMGTTLHSMMAYNPTANGMVERTHCSLKAALMPCCTDKNWRAQLPWVLLGLRTAPKADGDISPAEKVYRETLAVPGEFSTVSQQHRHPPPEVEGTSTETYPPPQQGGDVGTPEAMLQQIQLLTLPLPTVLEEKGSPPAPPVPP
ncbi:uncharacterized protein [Macrobrachium rosenbergii]|uniref:uncharacterized protein n=1 Tax=Macrobrachium rosenbergii TaxID=79674 RepID=UPI0034D488A4